MASNALHLSMSSIPLALAHALVGAINEDAATMAELAGALYRNGDYAETLGTMRRQKNLDGLADIGKAFGYETRRFRFDGWMPRFDDKNSNVRLLDMGPIALTIASSTAWRPTGRKPKYRPHLIEPTNVQNPLFTMLGPPRAPYEFSRLLIVAYEIDRTDPTLARVGRIRLRAAACDGTADYIDLGDMRAYAARYEAVPTAEVPEATIPLEAIRPLGGDGLRPEVHDSNQDTQETADEAGDSGKPNS